jgi:hypothetical protein
MQSNKEQNYLSIVAVLNQDTNNAEAFLTTIKGFCEQKFNNFEFILVDNNAPKEVVNNLVSNLTNTGLQANLITLPYELNKEQAVLTGVDAAIGDYVFEFEDTDLDYTVDDLWQMYQTCQSGHDIVLLKPDYKTGFLEQKFYKLLAKHSNKNSILYQSRIHLISRRAINRVNNINKVVHYRKYAYCNSGLDYAFIEYNSTQQQKHGKPNWNKVDYATDLLLIFTNLGKRISILFSLLFAIISVLAIAYTIFAYATVNVVYGWTTMMLLLSISFTGVFACFGIVIKYLNLILSNQQQDETLIASKRRI